MNEESQLSASEQSKLFNLAFLLAVFTIVYNIAEGIIATYLGYEDESLALFGFGSDSFIEVISGLGIAVMVLRIKSNPASQRNKFEKTALKITGSAFYLLAIALIATSLYNLYYNHQPQTTLWGIVISLISIAIMWATILWKSKIGHALNSEAILADTECAKVCIYMSVILLLSSALYEFFNVPYVDSIGTLGLAYLSFKEGKECFEKAASEKYCSCDSH